MTQPDRRAPRSEGYDGTMRYNRRKSDRELDKLGQLAETSGRCIVELAGVLTEIDRASSQQLAMVDAASAKTQNLAHVTEGMHSALGAVSEATGRALDNVQTSVTQLRKSSDRSRNVAGWVGDLEGALESVEQTLSAVTAANSRISKIAKHVNILAVNAKIEAARAGTLGQGFAVVAEAINALSRETSQAADDVTGSTGALSRLIGDLRKGAHSIATDAAEVLNDATETDAALVRINEDVEHVADDTSKLSAGAGEIFTAIQEFAPEFERLAAGLRSTANDVHAIGGLAEEAVDSTERAVQVTVKLGAANRDGKFIELVTDHAAQVASLFEQAVADRLISMSDLFSTHYTPILNTDPQQVMAPFTELTDQLLTPLQESLLQADQRIIFCAGIDRNGYLPTHNLKFSHPQGHDPVWNAANCRNRRIFDDRVGLKAGRNTQSFLMQTYRRDMGGGTFVLMKDISAPIFVDGRHWGGFRMGFKPAP